MLDLLADVVGHPAVRERDIRASFDQHDLGMFREASGSSRRGRSRRDTTHDHDSTRPLGLKHESSLLPTERYARVDPPRLLGFRVARVHETGVVVIGLERIGTVSLSLGAKIALPSSILPIPTRSGAVSLSEMTLIRAGVTVVSISIFPLSC